jgi:predicted AAA+ superfamily ATPase
MLNKENVAKLIQDFHKSKLPSPIFERKLELPLDLNIRRAITVIGPRRAGKSYLLFHTIQKLLDKGVEKSNILYINFEDFSFEHSTPSELEKIFEVYFDMYPSKRNEKLWLFFDEIQEIDGWERFVRKTLDDINAQVFLSGSSSKLLSREIATSMRGRSISYSLLTLDFQEFLEFKGIKISKFLSSEEENKLAKLALEYVKFGGYPEVALYSGEKEKLLKELIDVTLQRDIVERYGVRNIKVLRLLINALSSSFEFSVHKFFNFLKSNGYMVSKNTLYTYINAINDAFIVAELKKYSKSVIKEEQSVSKFYMLDNGLSAVSNAQDSKLFENAVFNSLYRREGIKLAYYADQSSEVDFAISKKGSIKSLIQAAYSLGDFSTREREFNALLHASEKLHCNSLYIITLNESGTELYKGKKIKIIPIWKFMLGRE